MRQNESYFYPLCEAIFSYFCNNPETETCFDVVELSAKLRRKSSVDVNDVLLHFKYIRIHHLIWGVPEVS